MGNKVRELSAEELRYRCKLDELDFESTEELPELKEIIGQPRATRAIDFGINIPTHGFNIYALGPPASGKTFTVKSFLERKAAEEGVPDDWGYVNNFSDPYKPRAIRLPPGKGIEFQRDMDRLIDRLRSDIPRAFESGGYEEAKERISSDFNKMRKAELERLEKRVKERGFLLARTPAGLLIAPAIEGEALSPEQYKELPKEEQRKIDQARQELQESLEATLRRIRDRRKKVDQRISQLDKEVAGPVVGSHIEELKEKYGQIPDVLDYLEEVGEDVVEKVKDFKSKEEGAQIQVMGMEIPLGPTPFTRYKVNVIVDNSEMEGAPVVVEHNPTYRNLIGRIEHRTRFGALFTDFTMLKPGALHRANGGYLMMEARDVLTRPFAWEALKRAIENNEIRMEELSERYQVISTVTMEPEPIPLDVKVVLIGNPLLYYLLYDLDEDFQKFFKVKADFDVQMDRTPENMRQYALLIKDRCEEEGLKHFDRSGVARVMEYSSRLMEDQEKLSTRFGLICDLLREASYWAGKNGHQLVTADDVQQAIEEKFYRSNLAEERIRELIEDGTIFIDTDGGVEGQVNGISIIQLGDYTFGKPSRITARTFMGKSGVVNIEREVEMSGRIHNKAVMGLAAYLGGRYAQDVPLALSASISFEQLYEEVEGDSASSTELYALLSSLSGYPLKQGIAVTGSVNQRGEIQPVGGVTRKIEGFFDVCRVKGLTGEQGVIIPAQNVKNLMLRDDVVEAVEEGKFHIYPVETVDQGIEILTGVEAGEREEDWSFPEGTVNWAVEKRLRELAEEWSKYRRVKEEEK